MAVKRILNENQRKDLRNIKSLERFINDLYLEELMKAIHAKEKGDNTKMAAWIAKTNLTINQ